MSLPPIPVVDIRESSPAQLVRDYPEKAQALIHASRNIYGAASRIASHLALPLGDAVSHRWLQHNKNPYHDEITHSAKVLKSGGVYALNLCYEWGCTSAALQGDSPILTRVLDWPFRALGENMVVAHQRGSAGDFYNVTWPAVAGVYQAMMPGRFAVALNQAPMRRYKTGIALDWARNRRLWYKQRALPPAHLLRKVCEEAGTYAEAREILTQTPVALPVIYTLAGVNPGEGCVIERLETSAALREMGQGRACAANHFETHLNGHGHGWMPRATQSALRSAQATRMPMPEDTGDFSWFTLPVANHLSRLALVAIPAEGKLAVMGTEGGKPVTELFRLG